MIPTTHWIRFTEYHKLADLVGMRGAVYGFVWSDMKPSSTDSPSDLAGNVSILESLVDSIMTNKMVTEES